MKTPNEIIKENHLEFNIITGSLVVNAIKQAQKEAYNQAIEDVCKIITPLNNGSVEMIHHIRTESEIRLLIKP